jgi:hypothetical protein
MIVGLHKVSIVADRVGQYARKFTKEAEADLDPPSGDLVRGNFLGLSAKQLRGLPRLRNLQLLIEGSSYRLISIEENGGFIAVKEA